MPSFYTCVPKITIHDYDVRFLRYSVTYFFTILGHFCTFTPLTILKINIWNNVKNASRYYPFTHVYPKWRSYDVWFLRYKAQQTEFFVVLVHFLPFELPNNLKNQKLKKTKKKKKKKKFWRYYHFTLVYHKWHHIKYASLLITLHEKNFSSYYPFTYANQKLRSYDECFLRYKVWQNSLSFWAIFCPFNPLTTRKIKILKKKKKMPGDIIILHKCTINDNHVIYGSWDMKHDRQIILGLFLHFYSTNNPKNQNFEKIKQKSQDIILLHKCTKNHDHMLYFSWDIMHHGCNL